MIRECGDKLLEYIYFKSVGSHFDHRTCPKVVETRSNSLYSHLYQIDSFGEVLSGKRLRAWMSRIKPEAVGDSWGKEVEKDLKKDAVWSKLIQFKSSLYLFVFVEFIKITCLWLVNIMGNPGILAHTYQTFSHWSHRFTLQIKTKTPKIYQNGQEMREICSIYHSYLSQNVTVWGVLELISKLTGMAICTLTHTSCHYPQWLPAGVSVPLTFTSAV